MSINNAGNEMREEINEMTTSANRFAIIIVVVTILFAILASFALYEFFAGIAQPVELIQAVLLCSFPWLQLV